MDKSLKVEYRCWIGTNFLSHPTVKKIMAEFGNKGNVTVFFIISEIGKTETLAVAYNDTLKEKYENTLPGYSRNLFDMIVRKLAKANFIDRKSFFKSNIITPPSSCIFNSSDEFLFQKVTSPYCLLRCNNSEETIVNSEEMGVNSEKTGVNSELIRVNMEEAVINSEEKRVYPEIFCNNLK